MATSHEEYRKAVVELATLHGYHCYWTWESHHSPKGFPDLVMVRGRTGETTPKCIIFAELKAGKDKLTAEQMAWGEIINEVGMVIRKVCRDACFDSDHLPVRIGWYCWHREVDTLDRLAEILA